MVKLIIAVILGVILYLVNIFARLNDKKEEKKLKAYLQTLEQFEIDLETAEVEGTHWSEVVPTDVYGTELDPNSDHFYRTSGFHGFRNRYHKDKRVTKFSSRILITFPYNGVDHTAKIQLPIEDTTVRMKFYLKKKTTVFVEKIDQRYNYIIDLSFLERRGSLYIAVADRDCL